MDTLSLLRAGKLAGSTRLDLSCGLTRFPPEIFELADTLEILSLSQNRLSDLPDDLPRLGRLRILFCSDNDFRHVPDVLGECASLSMVGFKSNRIESVAEGAIPRSLRWLILTDNRIGVLPATLGDCTSLQKLMLSGNRLQQLPDEMAACENLELMRLASNQFHSLPDWLFDLPRLSWLAFAGNPCSTPHATTTRSMSAIDWNELDVQEKLGEGASGVIYKARRKPGAQQVAVKLFKGAVTSDGLPACEMAACLAADTHPNLIQVLGRLANHPSGTVGLVMSLIAPEFKTLADPPSFDSCTRDVYAHDIRLDLPSLVQMALGLASVARQLHGRGIMHGDLYAHNVLWNAHGDCLLGDFGAASFYPMGDELASVGFQRIEVRAFGCLLEELLTRCAVESRHEQVIAALWTLQARCAAANVTARPLFAEIEAGLRELSDALPR